MMAAHAENPLISIIIVNYNGCDLLGPCLESVIGQRYRPVEIILVDNASSDGSVDFVRSTFPQVRVLTNRKNLGFAGGNNSGFLAATGEYVALLNNDTVVDAEWLSALYNHLTTHETAIACSRVLTDGVPAEYYEMNGTINYLGYNIMRQFTDLSQVFYAGAASVMLRRALVDRPFIDEYFLYHEDVYLSWRLRLLGYSPCMVQDSVVYHRGSASTRRQPGSLVTFYQERNRVLNAFMFYETRTLVLLIPYFLIDAVAKLVMSVFGRGKSTTGILRGYWWLLTHVPWIRSRRREHQASRVVPDRDVMGLMSPKMLDSDSVPARVCNALCRSYASMVRLAYHE